MSLERGGDVVITVCPECKPAMMQVEAGWEGTHLAELWVHRLRGCSPEQYLSTVLHCGCWEAMWYNHA